MRRTSRWFAAAVLTCGLGGAALVAVPTSPTAFAAPTTCTLIQGVRTWPLRRVAWQTVVVPIDENHVRDVSTEVAEGVGGVILFGNSAPSNLGAELTELLAKAPDGIAPVVMTDEEGGAVQRMANLVGSMPSARRMAASMTPRQVRRLARRVGARMYAAHVTMDLAPVLDLDDRPGPSATNPDGTRAFSIDPAVARAYGLAFAAGLLSANVVPVVKHFPGLGHATTNPDYGAAWTQPWSSLRHAGLLPFKAAIRAGLPAVMVTTARVPGLTHVPATLARAAIHRVLRAQLDFHGLVVTDSLSAGAIRDAGFTVRRAAVRALAVGADMVLFNAAPGEVADLTQHVVHAIVHAVRTGDLTRTRLRRAAVHVLKAKHAAVACG